MTSETRSIAVLGAGAIGCYVGGHWAAANAAVQVTLIGRQAVLNGFATGGLVLDGHRVRCPNLQTTSRPDALADAELIVLSSKATGLDHVIEELQSFAPPTAPILVLMNGLEPVRMLRSSLPDRKILAGMVPFNVVWEGPDTLSRSSAGEIVVEDAERLRTLADLTAKSAAPIEIVKDVDAIQYGKLLLNLINPINALSGISLYDMLSQSAYRQIYAETLAEALSVYDAAGVTWRKVGPFSPRLACRLLRLPDWAFNRTLLRLQKIDRSTMTSMATDVLNGKLTEIEVLNGEILRLAQAHGVPAPINGALVRLIREQSGPARMSAGDLATALGLF